MTTRQLSCVVSLLLVMVWIAMSQGASKRTVYGDFEMKKGRFQQEYVSVSATNNMEVTIMSGGVALSGVGSASLSTNQITLANPGNRFVGQRVTLIYRPALSSNAIKIVNSGNVHLKNGLAEVVFIGGPDSLTLTAVRSNRWAQASPFQNNRP